MFENLTEKLDGIFKKLKSRGRLDEENIKDSMKEIRMALLEADVNFRVVKDFVEDVRAKAVGQEVLESLTPGQQVVKIVHDRLVELMGGAGSQWLKLSGRFPNPVMLVGLQGCGKTTTAAKLARLTMEQGRRTALVSLDVYRPAAIEQLRVLGESLGAGVLQAVDKKDPVEIALAAMADAESQGYDVLIMDTAGRLHIDASMMDELKRVKAATNPSEILFVADAMTGQDAVQVAQKFDETLSIDGVILTKMDGDARGGAALSLRAVTGKPIKFIGVGEKIEALEVFHPERMASRILGLGDILTLVEKAQAAVDLDDAQRMEEKMRKGQFSLEDFLEQLRQMKKLGPLESIVGLLPGGAEALKGQDLSKQEKEFRHMEAMVCGMTTQERRNPHILNARRRQRIAKGSGVTVTELNTMLNRFAQMQQMMKKMGKFQKMMARMGGGPAGLLGRR